MCLALADCPNAPDLYVLCHFLFVCFKCFHILLFCKFYITFKKFCATFACQALLMVVWHSDSTLVSINEVNLHRHWLVLGWVTMSRFISRCRTFISICNQPPRPTQPSILPGSVSEEQLRLGRKRQEWFILFVDEHGVCR